MRTYGQDSDWQALVSIDKALMRKFGHLTMIRRDSPEWAAWRSWFRERDLPTDWTDKQSPEFLLTVTCPYPPTHDDLQDIPSLIARMTGGKASALKE